MDLLIDSLFILSSSLFPDAVVLYDMCDFQSHILQDFLDLIIQVSEAGKSSSAFQDFTLQRA